MLRRALSIFLCLSIGLDVPASAALNFKISQIKPVEFVRRALTGSRPQSAPPIVPPILTTQTLPPEAELSYIFPELRDAPVEIQNAVATVRRAAEMARAAPAQRRSAALSELKRPEFDGERRPLEDGGRIETATLAAPAPLARAIGRAKQVGAGLGVLLPLAASQIPHGIAGFSSAQISIGVAVAAAGLALQRLTQKLPVFFAYRREASILAMLGATLTATMLSSLGGASEWLQPILSAATALTTAQSMNLIDLVGFVRGFLKRGEPQSFQMTTIAKRPQLTLRPDQFGKPYLLISTLTQGHGDKTIAPNVSASNLVYFKRIGNKVAICLRDEMAWAKPGSPEAYALRDSMPDNIEAMVDITSVHPVTGAITFDVARMFLQNHRRPDMFNDASYLGIAYGGKYTMDADASVVENIRSRGNHLDIDMVSLYRRQAEDRPEDADANFDNVDLSARLSLMELPEDPMPARLADSRLSHFQILSQNYSAMGPDVKDRTHAILQKHRLEKADPTAAVSRPKKPIVFWIATSVPKRFRAAVRQGVLDWNKAFLAAGFIDAIEVRDAPEDGSFDPYDVEKNVIQSHWDKGADWAYGQVDSNPLTGEIVRTVIFLPLQRLDRISGRLPDTREPGEERIGMLQETLGDPGQTADDPTLHLRRRFSRGMARERAHTSASLADSALWPLAHGRNGLTDEEIFEQARYLTRHEIGHGIGDDHDHENTEIKNPEKLSQQEFDFAYSDMAYLPWINPIGARVDQPNVVRAKTGLGAIDILHVLYAYAPDLSVDQLREIASFTNQPLLRVSKDNDVGINPHAGWDLLLPPIEEARLRFGLVKDAFEFMEGFVPRPDEDYHKVFEGAVSAYGLVRNYARAVVSVVGGRRTSRQLGPDAEPQTPVSGDYQREALKFLGEEFFSGKIFSASPRLRRRLVRSRQENIFDWWKELEDFDVDDEAFALQSSILVALISRYRLGLVDKGAAMSEPGTNPMTSREVLETVFESIWSEIYHPKRVRGNQKRTISQERMKLQEFLIDMLMRYSYVEVGQLTPRYTLLYRETLVKFLKKLKSIHGNAKGRAGWSQEALEYFRAIGEHRVRRVEDHGAWNKAGDPAAE